VDAAREPRDRRQARLRLRGVEHDGENYIIASELVNAVAKKFGWSDYHAFKLFKARRSSI